MQKLWSLFHFKFHHIKSKKRYEIKFLIQKLHLLNTQQQIQKLFFSERFSKVHKIYSFDNVHNIRLLPTMARSIFVGSNTGSTLSI